MLSQATLQRHGGQSVNVSLEGKPSTFTQVKKEDQREGKVDSNFFQETFRPNAAGANVFVVHTVLPYRRECVHLSTHRAGRGAASEALLVEVVIFPKRSGFL